MVLLSRLKAVFSEDKHLIRFLKNTFGFYPGNLILYKLALLHRSAATEKNGHRISNERLEYLGDAVLSSIVADYLFKKFPYREEGFLTEMRSKLVSRDQLNKLSVKLGLEKFIQSNQIGRVYSRSITGDAFEALVGAIYLDKGYNFTRRIIIQRIINVHFDIDELEKVENNFKSKLFEWAQRERKEIKFNVANEISIGNIKQYSVVVLIDDVIYGNGCDFSIKGAEKIAAEKAYHRLLEENSSFDINQSN